MKGRDENGDVIQNRREVLREREEKLREKHYSDQKLNL